MNSSIINVSEILNNARSLISAGFSAGYNFEITDAEKYFDNLIESSQASSPIFSGILILESDGDNFIIIDGLQRLTTINLLMCALCETYEGTSEKNQEAKNKIYERYLTDNNEPKLKLTGTDQNIYKKILFSKAVSDKEASSNLVKSYITFLRRIQEQKISGTELFRILSKIKFMTVITDKSEVSARELYQAINDNKEKSQINLISDFVLHEDKSINIIWKRIVGSFNKQSLVEDFINDFLITRSDDEIPNKNSLYNNFKNYYYKILKYQSPKTIFENIHKYSQYYLRILNADFENPQILEQIEILNKNNSKDAYPYLMEVLDDLENSHIDSDAFLNILTMINSFIKSREESQIFNIDFALLSKELNKMLILKDYTPDFTEENKLTINDINNLSTFGV